MSTQDDHMWEENPFDALGLDPRSSPAQLTHILRERAELALPEERVKLQGLWQKLTLKTKDRVRWALTAHPRAHDVSGPNKTIASLRQAIVPTFLRGTPAPLETRVCDALCMPDDDAPLSTSSLAPPSFFATLKAQTPKGHP